MNHKSPKRTEALLRPFKIQGYAFKEAFLRKKSEKYLTKAAFVGIFHLGIWCPEKDSSSIGPNGCDESFMFYDWRNLAV